MRVGDARGGKSLLKSVEVMMHGFAIEMIHHPAFSARGSTLHLLFSASYLDVVGAHAINNGIIEDGFAGSLIQRDMRSAERPASATVHIHFDT